MIFPFFAKFMVAHIGGSIPIEELLKISVSYFGHQWLYANYWPISNLVISGV